MLSISFTEFSAADVSTGTERAFSVCELSVFVSSDLSEESIFSWSKPAVAFLSFFTAFVVSFMLSVPLSALVDMPEMALTLVFISSFIFNPNISETVFTADFA